MASTKIPKAYPIARLMCRGGHFFLVTFSLGQQKKATRPRQRTKISAVPKRQNLAAVSRSHKTSAMVAAHAAPIKVAIHPRCL